MNLPTLEHFVTKFILRNLNHNYGGDANLKVYRTIEIGVLGNNALKTHKKFYSGRIKWVDFASFSCKFLVL